MFFVINILTTNLRWFYCLLNIYVGGLGEPTVVDLIIDVCYLYDVILNNIY